MPQMTQTMVWMYEVLQQACEDAALETLNYSGRGMYGKKCLGVTGDEGLGPLAMSFRIVSGLVRMVDMFVDSSEKTFKKEDLDELLEHMESAQSDSMGRSTVLYFPQLEVP